MESGSDIDIENSCRTCLALITDFPDRSFESIFGLVVENTEFKEILLQVIPEVNLENEKLSQIICSNCSDSIMASFNFQKMAYENERNVLMLLNLRDDACVQVDIKIEPIIDQNMIVEGEEIHETSADIMLPEEITEELIEELHEDESEVNEENCEIEEVEPEYEEDLENIIGEKDFTDSAENVKTKSDSVKLHKCESCPKKFKKLSLLTRHQKTHVTDKKPHECSKCRKRFPSEVALVRHDVLHSDMVERSKIVRSDNQKFICVICNSQFKTPETLSNHHKTHKSSLENDREIPCKLCQDTTTFETFTDIVRHSKNHFENATHQCIICKKLFILNDEAIDHFLRHKGQKPHKCPDCGKSFLKLHKLNVHLKIHDDDKNNSYLCPECGKSLSTNENLKRHLIRHTGIKPFSCSLCPSKFVFKSGLTSHMSTHSGLKPYVCDICGSCFTKSSSLTKHHRIHTGERPYVCEVCGMRFNSSDHVKRHVRTHTGERPYKCQFCERSYAQSNDLLKHTRIHVGENTYKCVYCSEAFRLQNQLREHYRTHYDASKSSLKHLENEEQKDFITEIFVDEQQRRDQLEFVQSYEIIKKERERGDF